MIRLIVIYGQVLGGGFLSLKVTESTSVFFLKKQVNKPLGETEGRSEALKDDSTVYRMITLGYNEYCRLLRCSDS